MFLCRIPFFHWRRGGFSGCRGCMNGRIGKVVREMEFHGTVDGFCCQVLGTGSLEEDFTVDTV